MNEKRYAESVAMSQKALQLNDKNYLVWANLMSAYQALNQKDNADAARDRAIALLEKTVKLQPQDALTQVSLALFYAQEGPREKALTRVQAALARAPENLKCLNLRAKRTRISATAPTLSSTSRKPCKRAILSMTSRVPPSSKMLLSDPNFRPNTKK